MVNSTTENQGSKTVPFMSAVGYIIATGILIFFLPLIPILAVIFVLTKFQAKNKSMKNGPDGI